jgi:hypothetical protein
MENATLIACKRNLTAAPNDQRIVTPNDQRIVTMCTISIISNINYLLSGKFYHYFHKKKFSE